MATGFGLVQQSPLLRANCKSWPGGIGGGAPGNSNANTSGSGVPTLRATKLTSPPRVSPSSGVPAAQGPCVPPSAANADGIATVRRKAIDMASIQTNFRIRDGVLVMAVVFDIASPFYPVAIWRRTLS